MNHIDAAAVLGGVDFHTHNYIGFSSAELPFTEAVEAISEDPARVGLAGELISIASRGSDVRWDKINELRRLIRVGAYRVSGADLADKLIDSMRG